MTDNVIHYEFKKASVPEDELVTDIKDLIYSYAGRITNATVFGVLEIVRHDLEREIL